jgi:trehalose 6-phosphate phosphatase
LFANRPAKVAGIYEVWRSASISRLRPRDVLLVTDFDGTLAEIVSDPSQAAIVPASLAALRRLAALLRRVVVLSSRPTADLESRVGLPGVDLIGDSGLSDLSAAERERLDRFKLEAARLLSDLPGIWLEMKPGATAVHFRHARSNAEQLMKVLGPVVHAIGLYAQPGRRVIEVLPRRRPKGEALRAIIERRRPGGVICIGDDENDRPMFEVVSELVEPHLNVGVSSAETRPDLFALCDLVVSGPEEVSRFLTMVAEWAAEHRI